jgi:hypothetical protein
MAEANSPTHKTWCRLLEKEKQRGFDSLSGEEKDFYRVYLLEHETYRGRLQVWFYQGEHHNRAATALRNIGADKSARIIEDAMKFVFPEGIAPQDESARRCLYQKLDLACKSLKLAGSAASFRLP